ncbi:hypothetical protein D081_1541 [Anaerovibrio sp. JC8]|nr:hypothetical protein D081_1541 [Anaerovibrio sp. JC8]
MKQDYDSLRALNVYAGVNRKTDPCVDDVDDGYIKDVWADFANDETYKRMAAQGGTKSQNDVDELLAAAESYHWQNSYKNAGIYDQSMFDFADKIRQNTGVAIVTNGSEGNITKALDGLLFRVDDYTFQTMAQHQDHMDIWENIVNGTYESYAEITKNIMDTNDESLIEDWKIACQWRKGSFSQELKSTVYNKYAAVTLDMYEDFDTTKKGATAKDFWTEVNYNTHITESYSSRRDYSDYLYHGFGAVHTHTSSSIYFGLHQTGNVPYYMVESDNGDLYNPTTGKLFMTKAQQEEEFIKHNPASPQTPTDVQIEMLQNKIKETRKKLSSLQNVAELSDSQKRQAATYRRMIESYQNQIQTLQGTKLEYDKAHVLG